MQYNKQSKLVVAQGAPFGAQTLHKRYVITLWYHVSLYSTTVGCSLYSQGRSTLVTLVVDVLSLRYVRSA